MKDIEFFGSVDRKEGKSDGYITSEYPAWMHKFQIDDMEETIARQEREIARGAVAPDQIIALKEDVKKSKAKIALIKASRPEFSDTDKDDMYKVYTKLGKVIQDDLFTYSEMQLGTASAHEEASRMVDKRIPLEAMGLTPKMMSGLNIRHNKGKISRDDASKVFKVFGNLLGEPTNVETLRRDKVTSRTSRKKSE